jgi:Arc/MetJ family transcription regulator
MPRDEKLCTISVNLPVDVVDRLRRLGFNHRLSASSIVEAALRRFLGDATDEELAAQLRSGGATLRRS